MKIAKFFKRFYLGLVLLFLYIDVYKRQGWLCTHVESGLIQMRIHLTEPGKD